jgi:hypothetical protein
MKNKPLIFTNQYLKKAVLRSRLLNLAAASSSAIEGIHSGPAVKKRVKIPLSSFHGKRV